MSDYINADKAVHGHYYRLYKPNTGEVITCDKLPPILKIIRTETDYTFKVPHGNKVRTIILEEGVCSIVNGKDIYEITIVRW